MPRAAMPMQPIARLMLRCSHHVRHPVGRMVPSALASTSGRSFSSYSASGGSKTATRLRPKTCLNMYFSRFHDKPGLAGSVLSIIGKHDLQLTHLESKLYNYSFDGATIEVDIDGITSDSPKLKHVIEEVKALGVMVDVRPALEVPWFPISRKELDYCVEEVIGSGTGGLLAPDHPGFHDEHYKKRREEIASIANSFREGDGRLPHIEYTAEEVATWKAVYERLEVCHAKWACNEFKDVFPELKAEAGYGPEQIPQLQDISDYLQSRTGFRLRPVCGLLSARDFLNALAFRTFCSTQYIRHGGNPFYTPEPDVCHELIGHVPLLADPHFAEFTQKVGLASLGAPDEAIVRLANIYWFTVEFGLVKNMQPDPFDSDPGSRVKVMGAGILSSFGEMEWSASAQPSEECRQMGGIARDYPALSKPALREFMPEDAAVQPYPITTYQPMYFVGESLRSMKDLIGDYCDRMDKKFYPVYDPITGTLNPSRHVSRLPRTSTVHIQAEKQKAYFESLGQ